MRPTAEQSAIVDSFQTGGRLKINAYAGTGKTSTLTLLGRSSQKPMIYLAFNKAIATEAAAKFPRNVTCQTNHALAFRAIAARGYDTAKMTGALNGGLLASMMRYHSREYAPGFLASGRHHGFLVIETLRRWMRSDADRLALWCVPREGKLAELPPDVMLTLALEVLQDAERVWFRMTDKADKMPLGHDGYLKLWALGEPQIPADVVMLDEAQDTNGVVLGVFQKQQGQTVCVGDTHQAIYAWRGAVNAMEKLPCDVDRRITKSFRFGPEVADYASRILRLLGEKNPLVGNDAIASKLCEVEGPDAWLFRTNSRLIEALMGLVAKDRKPFVVGGTGEIMSMVEASEKLQAGRPVEYPLDFFGFNNWQEVQESAEREDGADLKRWVKLIDDWGCANLKATLRALPGTEGQADIVLSTGHKSKGREWGKVRLENDFLRGVSFEGDNARAACLTNKHDEELRLFYVAVTRAQLECDIDPTMYEKVRGLGEIKRAAGKLAA